jgi:hypothetical protein
VTFNINVTCPTLDEIKELLVTNQEKLDAIAAAIDQATADLTAEIASLKAAVANGQTLDFTALDAKVAALGALDTANPPPAP